MQIIYKYEIQKQFSINSYNFFFFCLLFFFIFSLFIYTYSRTGFLFYFVDVIRKLFCHAISSATFRWLHLCQKKNRHMNIHTKNGTKHSWCNNKIWKPLWWKLFGSPFNIELNDIYLDSTFHLLCLQSFALPLSLYFCCTFLIFFLFRYYSKTNWYFWHIAFCVCRQFILIEWNIVANQRTWA